MDTTHHPSDLGPKAALANAADAVDLGMADPDPDTRYCLLDEARDHTRAALAHLDALLSDGPTPPRGTMPA